MESVDPEFEPGSADPGRAESGLLNLLVPFSSTLPPSRASHEIPVPAVPRSLTGRLP